MLGSYSLLLLMITLGLLQYKVPYIRGLFPVSSNPLITKGHFVLIIMKIIQTVRKPPPQVIPSPRIDLE